MKQNKTSRPTWIVIIGIICIVVFVGIGTNKTLRSIEKKLPNSLLLELNALSVVMESLSETVQAAERAQTLPNSQNLEHFRSKLDLVFYKLVEFRDSYVYDNMVHASAFHSVVAPAVADLKIWLIEGVSGFGPENKITVTIAYDRITKAYRQAKELNKKSKLTAQKILDTQKERLDQFLIGVNLLFGLIVITAFSLIYLLFRQYKLQYKENLARSQSDEATLIQVEAVRAANVGLWDWNLKTNKLQYSDEWKKQIGYSPHEIGHDFNEWESRVHPKDLPDTLAFIKKQISEKQNGFKVEFRFQHKGGHYIWIFAQATILQDDTGMPIRALGSHLDITERKQSEYSLKKSLEETQLRQKETDALLKASQAIPSCKTFEEAARIIFDISKETIGARSGYVALLSEDGDENEVLFLDAGGLPCTVDPELPMPIRGLREVAYRNQKVAYDNNFSQSEWMKYMPSGHVGLKNVLFAPLNIHGQTVGIIGLANKPGAFDERDVQIIAAFCDLAAIALTYVKYQEDLQESEKFLNTIVENIPDMIFVKDAEKLGFVRLNKAGTIGQKHSGQNTDEQNQRTKTEDRLGQA